MSPHFWNCLLAVDPAGTRFGGLLETLRTSPLDPVTTLLADRSLTDADRKKLARLDTRRLAALLEKGVFVLEGSELGPSYQQAQGTAPALFAWGDRSLATRPCLGVVGTRTASHYGKALATKFSEAIAAAGICIVSGAAFGVDQAAHRGALQVGGGTLAVLGTGIDITYPAAASELFRELRDAGLLVSQFPVGTPSLERNFLARNYTIASLCDALLVIEAPGKSGSLVTARYAAELGKEVFVVPGPITLESFRGSHGLIRDGATLVDHPSQIAESMGWDLAPISAQSAPVSGAQQALIAALEDRPLAAEALAKAAGMEPAEALVELTFLEMEGIVVRTDAGYARKP